MKSPKHATKLTPVNELYYLHVKFIHGCIRCPDTARSFHQKNIRAMKPPEELPPTDKRQPLTPEQAEALSMLDWM